jgi:hypothetical protein
MNRSRFLFAVLALTLLIASNRVLAQHPGSQLGESGATSAQSSGDGLQAPIDEDIELLKRDVRVQSRLIVEAKMDLTDDEAKKFWPLYDQYSSEKTKIDDDMAAVIRDYLQTYATMDGDRAESYVRKRAAIEESLMQLRLKYIPIFRKALSGRMTALFFQIDWRLGLLTNLQLAQMPMIDPRPW